MYLYMCVCIQMMCFTTRMDHVLKLNELLKAQLWTQAQGPPSLLKENERIHFYLP